MRVLLANIIKIFLTIFNKSGTTLPGRVLNTFYKDTLEKYRDQYKNIILISGTNGKTTINRILTSVLSKGYSVISNQEGANLHSGITTTVLLSQGIFRKKTYDFLILEVDESIIGMISNKLEANYLLIGNLTMDQIDRHINVLTLAFRINDSIKKSDMKVIVNQNDPYAMLATKNTNQYLVRTLPKDQNKNNNQIINCLNCGFDIEIREVDTFIQNGSGGIKAKYHCLNCQLGIGKTIEPPIKWERKGSLSFRYNDQKITPKLSGLYNRENIIMSLALLEKLNISISHIKQGIGSIKKIKGRNETFLINGNKVTLQLVKNPASVHQTFKEIKGKDVTQIAFLFNNELSDGLDTTWIKQINFAKLNEFASNLNICIGGSQKDKIEEEIFDVAKGNNIFRFKDVSSLFSEKVLGETYILANYSLLSDIRRELVQLQREWES